ncbi:MAG: HAMP domain-containing sensor histidine kinase [Polaromonas sp.]|uniref:sensor histidine kinase n=1 Tax=Polaromonas sp. TaxID=1869339 RepID=UPI00273240CA|nr:HAMP domain-containing sensor histidine kinase [Polaromonas sp.]MDP2817702.1 HAMP domain-containing sensor histidine kinase [Polaromonas sp.]
MLYQFIFRNRQELVNRCLAKVAERSEITTDKPNSRYGISVFIDQLIKTLEVEQTSASLQSRSVSGPAGGPSEYPEIGESATQHGRELSELGFTIEQVVHDYGDLCQAITDLAHEFKEPIETDEFRTLNRCLDNAIADAVTEFTYQRRLLRDGREDQALNLRLGFLAHEMRNHINSITHAIGAIKSGQVGFGGATGKMLDKTLISLRGMADRTLTDVRLTAGIPVNQQVIFIADFVAEVKASAKLEAQSRGCEFSSSVVGLRLAIKADRDLLFSAVGNLLQNSFKFTQPGTKVLLTVYADGDNIRFDVQDQSGGLPPGNIEDLFIPFKQSGTDKSGSGLGLSICRRSVEANDGVLSVRDLPGSGSIFSISLPRHLPSLH